MRWPACSASIRSFWTRGRVPLPVSADFGCMNSDLFGITGLDSGRQAASLCYISASVAAGINSGDRSLDSPLPAELPRAARLHNILPGSAMTSPEPTAANGLTDDCRAANPQGINDLRSSGLASLDAGLSEVIAPEAPRFGSTSCCASTPRTRPHSSSSLNQTLAAPLFKESRAT